MKRTTAIDLKFSGRGDVDRFLGQDLSFSSILDVVVPLICALVDAKPLPHEIRGKLNAPRKLRNEFVHEGVLPAAIDAEQVRRLLCTATFGIECAIYL